MRDFFLLSTKIAVNLASLLEQNFPVFVFTEHHIVSSIKCESKFILPPNKREKNALAHVFIHFENDQDKKKKSFSRSDGG